MKSYPYPVKEGQQYINLNPGRLFVQQPPKKKEEILPKYSNLKAHLNYYASAYNKGKTTITSQDKTKSNTTK